MPSSYLTSGDYATYGVPAATTAAQVTAASLLIDLYLKRPDGLVWTPDGTGSPGWMAAATPSITLTYSGAIAANAGNTTINVNGAVMGIMVGDVFILDRATPSIAEPVFVQSIVINGQVATLQLGPAGFNHPGPVTLEGGMVIKQHKYMPDGRPITTLAYTPIARLISGQGRYGYGRRGDAAKYQVDEFNLLASLSHFGGPPAWEFFPVVGNNTGVDPGSGQVWVPAGVMLAYYSEVMLQYVAGYAAGNLPSAIKAACANIIAAQGGAPQLGAIKTYKAGDTEIVNFLASKLDDDTKMLLNEYRAKLYN
jgi:hypothetical protein